MGLLGGLCTWIRDRRPCQKPSLSRSPKLSLGKSPKPQPQVVTQHDSARPLLSPDLQDMSL